MENPSYFEEQKKTIAYFADVFLKQKFGFPSQPIKVLIDQDLVMIRVDNFLCPAELEMGMEKRNANLIHEMYAKIFNRVKSSLVKRIKQIMDKEVISSQININFETKVCMMTFFLSSGSPNK